MKSNELCSNEINGNPLNQITISLNNFYYLKVKENNGFS